MKHVSIGESEEAGEDRGASEFVNLLGRLRDKAEANGTNGRKAGTERSKRLPAAAKLARVRSIISARRVRAIHFAPELFADPAWDILLELYASHLSERRVSITSVSLGSGTPATTALRWMKALELRGFLQRRPDPLDGRRIFLELTLKGIAAMDALFAALPSEEALI